MAHRLESAYGLTAEEILEAIEKRFRLRAAVEGAIAEIKMEHHIKRCPLVERYVSHDVDGQPDFSIWLKGREAPLRAECKNVRESSKDGGEAYKVKGKIVAYKVETQKTRASQADATSRFYGADQFEILGVCLGKKTKNWDDILYAKVSDLTRHPKHPHKLSVFQKVPLPDSENLAPWYNSLGELLSTYATTTV